MSDRARLTNGEQQTGRGNSLETLNRSILVLKSFSMNDRELSLADLHRRLGFSKSSLQRILHTLVSNGFLEKDHQKKTYQFGLELYCLGKIAEEHSPLISAAKPIMLELSKMTGASVSLHIAERKYCKCVAFEAGDQNLSEMPYAGQTMPLHAGASGKLLLAYSSPRQIETYLHEKDELEAVTKSTLTDKGALLLDLWETRERGYAVSTGERVEGIYCVSAPVFDHNHQLTAGISISAHVLKLDNSSKANFIDLITRAAVRISKSLAAGELVK